VLLPDEAMWLAVQVAPQHEQHVAVSLDHKGVSHFLPSVSVRNRWSDRSKICRKPLFPGYLFCRTTRSSFGLILSTPGVFRIVCFGGRPCPIPDQEIEALERTMEFGKNIEAVPYPSVGEKVQIVDGPLMGVVGIIARWKNRHRLILSIDMIMRSVSVEIDPSQVALADPVAHPERVPRLNPRSGV
jgi:transcription antitermination factor NusG